MIGNCESASLASLQRLLSRENFKGMKNLFCIRTGKDSQESQTRKRLSTTGSPLPGKVSGACGIGHESAWNWRVATGHARLGRGGRTGARRTVRRLGRSVRTGGVCGRLGVKGGVVVPRRAGSPNLTQWMYRKDMEVKK